jgi:hypothetical protein
MVGSHRSLAIGSLKQQFKSAFAGLNIKAQMIEDLCEHTCRGRPDCIVE